MAAKASSPNEDSDLMKITPLGSGQEVGLKVFYLTNKYF